MNGHPRPEELEVDPPPEDVAAHLAVCPMCRVERRLMLDTSSRGPEAPAPMDRVAAVMREGPRLREDGPHADRYALGDPLGAGASGEVRRAWDPRLRRHLAVKVLTQRGDGARARFVSEAQLTAQLEHPHIVPIYDVGETTDGRPTLAMKEIHGESLAEAVKRGKLPTLGARVDALRRVCDAVAYAHHRGVLHRDLKPENVMVGEFGEVLVVDWGLARPLHNAPAFADAWADRFDDDATRTREGQIAGTPAYMAPEQARGELSRLDERTDIYALGGILYFLLLERRPIEGGDTASVLEAARAGNLRFAREIDARVPRELDAVVRRAMAFLPGDRYPSVRALREDLDAWIERRPLPHVGSSRRERLTKFAARNRTAVAGVGVTVTLGAMLFLGGAWRYAVDTGRARDAAVAEAHRAEAAEHIAVEEAAAARVALADTRIDQGREREAYAALTVALEALTAAGADTRAVEMEFGRLFAEATPPVSTCSPLGDVIVWSVSVSPDGRVAVGAGDDGRVATWDTAGCAVLQRMDVGARLPLGAVATAWVDGPAVVAAVGDEILHLRLGVGVVARTALPGLAAALAAKNPRRGMPGLGLSRSGEGWVVLENGVWSSFRFGAGPATPELPLPAPVIGLHPTPGLVSASLSTSSDPHAGIWSRTSGRLVLPLGVEEYASVAEGDRRAYVSRRGSLSAVDLPGGALAWTTNDGLPADNQGLVPGNRYIAGEMANELIVHDAMTGSYVGHALGAATLGAGGLTDDASVAVMHQSDGTVATFLPARRRSTVVAQGRYNTSAHVVFSPTGELAALGVDDAVSLLDTRTGTELVASPPWTSRSPLRSRLPGITSPPLRTDTSRPGTSRPAWNVVRLLSKGSPGRWCGRPRTSCSPWMALGS